MVSQPQRTLSLRGRGGGRGRGRGRDGIEPAALETPASSDGRFKLDAALEYLGEKYQKAADSQTTVYKSKAPAWGGGSTPMVEITSPDAFLKMLSSAAATFESKS
uniref:Uncharacterized protein n=1 Tax=Prymnesium polylepis TaxID=72548 RepID=A0A6T8CRS9_9EUKA|mmetsp:Transcript_52309/g.144786  ORF Transcript_52309/g.144786 Transcript_52309/m.144786 type:complete len:105 (-) Transcript_52309:137-451(-)|eukprot:2479626-Prymnesium_polylepis.4